MIHDELAAPDEPPTTRRVPRCPVCDGAMRREQAPVVTGFARPIAVALCLSSAVLVAFGVVAAIAATEVQPGNELADGVGGMAFLFGAGLAAVGLGLMLAGACALHSRPRLVCSSCRASVSAS